MLAYRRMTATRRPRIRERFHLTDYSIKKCESSHSVTGYTILRSAEGLDGLRYNLLSSHLWLTSKSNSQQFRSGGRRSSLERWPRTQTPRPFSLSPYFHRFCIIHNGWVADRPNINLSCFSVNINETSAKFAFRPSGSTTPEIIVILQHVKNLLQTNP